MLIVFSAKLNLLYLPLSAITCSKSIKRTEKLSSGSDKPKLFPKIFFKNSNLNDSSISLPGFPVRINLKLHNIHVTPKLVEKIISNLDLSKESGRSCILVVVLQKCEHEFSYILHC